MAVNAPPGAELYILVTSLTHSLTHSLTPSVRKLKISVNIDARTVKLGMKDLWTISGRF